MIKYLSPSFFTIAVLSCVLLFVFTGIKAREFGVEGNVTTIKSYEPGSGKLSNGILPVASDSHRTFPDAPVTTAPTLSASANTVVALPITVTGFSNIGAVSLTMKYNPAVLTFQSASVNQSFPSLFVNGNIPGYITVSGFSTSSGIYLPDNATLFTLYFYFSGSYTILEWYDNGSSCEYADWPNYNALNDIPQEDFYINGMVTEEGLIILDCPENITIPAQTGLCGSEQDFAAFAIGLPAPEIIYEIDEMQITSPFFFPVGSTIVDVTAQNEMGKINCSFVVQVCDNQPPVPPSDGSATVNCIQSAIEPSVPQAIDNCDGLLDGVLVDVNSIPDPILCEGIKIYTYSFSDQAGNSSTWNFIYTILPLTGPVLKDQATDCSTLNQANLDIGLQEAGQFNPTELESLVAAMYQDNCGGQVCAVLTSIIPGANNADDAWVFQYIFTISDLCENTLECLVEYSGGIVSQVPEDLLLENIIIAENEEVCFGASNTISVYNVMVEADGRLELIAGESILFYPDFFVLYHGSLHAYIGQDFCVNPRSLITSLPDPDKYDSIYQMTKTSGSFRVYPNPSEGIFNLVLDAADTGCEILVMNLQGIQVYREELNKLQQILDLTSQPAGVYIVYLICTADISFQKIISY